VCCLKNSIRQGETLCPSSSLSPACGHVALQMCASCRAAPHLAQGVNCFLRAALRGSFLRACLLAAQSAALNIRQNSSAPRIAYVQNRERRSCWRNVLRRRSDAATEVISSSTLAPAGRLITSILGNARRLRGRCLPPAPPRTLPPLPARPAGRVQAPAAALQSTLR